MHFYDWQQLLVFFSCLGKQLEQSDNKAPYKFSTHTLPQYRLINILLVLLSL